MVSSLFNPSYRPLPSVSGETPGMLAGDFKSLANFIPHIVWTALPGGEIEYLNQRGLEYLGMELAQIVGSGFERLMHPEDVHAAQRGWHDSLECVSAYEAECRLRRYDGVYRWHVVRALPALDDSGRIAHWFGTCTDVHDSRFASAMLAESEERFRVTFNQAALGIGHLSLEGRWLRVNDYMCSILGYPREELLDLTHQAITHPDDLIEGQRLAQRLISGKANNCSRETRFIRKDGSVVWTNTNIALARHRPGSPGFFIAVIEDISVRKATELELENIRRELEKRVAQRTAELSSALDQVKREMAERQRAQALNETTRLQMMQAAKMSALGEMASGIAHEVHGPLSLVREQATALYEQTHRSEPDPSETRETASRIIAAVDRVSRITTALCAFARENGRESMSVVPVYSLVQDTLEFCRQRLSQNGIELQIRVPGELTLLCRPAQISQVLLNLLNNSYDAVKGTASPWVRIEAFREGGNTILAVTDSGAGIEAEIAEKIMLPFFTTKELGHGAGLGLSISRGIVEDHGGELIVDKTAANTRLMISLPEPKS